MRTLLMGLAAFAATALIAASPAAAQRHGGMGGGAIMHQFHGGNFHGNFRGGMNRNFHGNFRGNFGRNFRGFRGRAVVVPGWGWGWAPYYDDYYDDYGGYYGEPYCPRWWWDGWGWRCAY